MHTMKTKKAPWTRMVLIPRGGKLVPASKLIRRRKPIRKRSKAMAKKMVTYRKRVAAFLKAHPICAVTGQTATEVHHKRGRIQSLLLDTRFWLPVSRSGHDYIHRNPAFAMDNGWLALPGEWGKLEP